MRGGKGPRPCAPLGPAPGHQAPFHLLSSGHHWLECWVLSPPAHLTPRPPTFVVEVPQRAACTDPPPKKTQMGGRWGPRPLVSQSTAPSAPGPLHSQGGCSQGRCLCLLSPDPYLSPEGIHRLGFLGLGEHSVMFTFAIYADAGDMDVPGRLQTIHLGRDLAGGGGWGFTLEISLLCSLCC